MNDIVQVQFKSRFRDEFSGRAYTYRTAVPLAVGDVVNVPTKYGDSEAKVCRIDVPEEEIAGIWCDLKTITEPATPGGGLFDGFF